MTMSGPTDKASKSDVEELCTELMKRWRQGDRVAVEHYLELYPTLKADETEAFELVYTEFLLHEELDHSHPVEEFSTRFPHQADRLRRQLDLHLAFESTRLFASGQGGENPRERHRDPRAMARPRRL